MIAGRMGLKREDFRAWLEPKHKESAVNTGIGTISRLEKKLAELGLPYTDLDTALEAGGLEQVRLALEAVRQDAHAGGERFRILMPDATDPVPRINGFLLWLRRYASFRKGDPVEADEDPVVLSMGPANPSGRSARRAELPASKPIGSSRREPRTRPRMRSRSRTSSRWCVRS